MYGKALPLWIALMVAGCARYVAPNDSQRLESIQSLIRSGHVDPATELLIKQRTAVIINGDIQVAEAIGDRQTLGVRFKTMPGAKLNGPSHAIAIDSRGYFLTAAHCTNEPSIYLIYFDGRSSQIALPRIVAKIHDLEKHQDFAVIHVDTKLPYVFEWASSKEVLPQRVAIAIGSSSLYGDSDRRAFCAQISIGGKISSKFAADHGTVVISNDLPLRPGDSGGPLATPEGTLLGVETGVQVSWTGTTTSIAMRPDLAWVANLIDEDLKIHHETPPSIPVLKNKRDANLVVSLW